MDRIIVFKGRQHRCASFIMILCLLSAFVPLQSEAYFNRGTVSVSLGESALSMTAGTVSSVSVTIDPIKQDQLPGCGMAECPQTCGDGCLNESGECMCAGTEYRTYYSEIAVASSDASVASASYANGTLTVQGHTPGTATITVTGKLRQYTDTTVTLPVTVAAAPSSTSADVQASSGSSGRSASTGSAPAPAAVNPVPQQDETGTVSGSTGESPVVVEEVPSAAESVPSPAASQDDPVDVETPDDHPGFLSSDETPGEAEEEGNSDVFFPEGEVRDTARGKYRFVELTPATDIPACFVDAANERSHLVFQKKNGDNIVYSWNFNGKNLDPGVDYSGLKLGIACSSGVPERLANKVKGKNAFCMSFEYSGKLPSPAEIYINVKDSFPEDEDLFLYRIMKSDGKLTKIDDHVEMSNGYASFSLKHCSDYLLTDSAVASGYANEEGESLFSSEDRLGIPLVILMVAAFVSAFSLLLYYFRNRIKRKQR